jgi:hypothetical protein
MTDYTQNRKFYSADNEFLSGSDIYTGYVIKKNGVFTDTSYLPLTTASTYLTDVHNSEFIRDRLVSDKLELPYLLSSIQLDVNDILTNELINKKLSYINSNTTYLFTRLQTPNNYLPAASNVRYAALSTVDSSEQWRWYNTIVSSTEYYDTSSYQSYENINRGVGITHTDDSSTFSLFCTTSTSFIVLTGSNVDLKEIEETVYVSPDSKDLQFKNITSIDYINNYLFVCDKGNNAVYKYDISRYLSNDTVLNNNRILVESIGSIGNMDDKGLLKEPTLVAVRENNIAIYDSGNKALKIYNQNFNHIRTITTGNFRREPAVAIKYDKFNNELYVLTLATDRSLKLYKIDDNYAYDSPVTLDEKLDTDEEVKEITFSENNSSVWYLTTTKFIYKKLVNKPERTIGAYDGGKIFVYYTYKWNYAFFTYNSAELIWNAGANRTSSYEGFIGITCEASPDNYDRIYMFKYGRFYQYDEPNDYINLLSYTNRENYSIDSISISSKEFVQPSVYNKEMYKVVSNLINIKNNIIGKYYGSYDLNGVYRFLGYNYLLDLNAFNIKNIKDFILHQNEGVNYFAINRTLTKVYQLQQSLLEAIDIEIDDLIPYPLTSNTLIIN